MLSILKKKTHHLPGSPRTAGCSHHIPSLGFFFHGICLFWNMDESAGKEGGKALFWSTKCQPCYLSYLGHLYRCLEHLNPLSGLDKQASPPMETAEKNTPSRISERRRSGPWAPTLPAVKTCFSPHSKHKASRYSRSSNSGSRWKTFCFLNVGALMTTFCMKEQVYGKVTGTGLYLWWAGAKRNKTGITFRIGKPNLTTQIINLKGHFTVPRRTQMLHFTLGKRYF